MYLIMRPSPKSSEQIPIAVTTSEHSALLKWAVEEAIRLNGGTTENLPEFSIDYEYDVPITVWIEGKTYTIIDCKLGEPINTVE